MYLCSRMIADFVRYLEAERRYSPLTVRNYRHDVEQFLAWLGVDDARFEPPVSYTHLTLPTIA